MQPLTLGSERSGTRHRLTPWIASFVAIGLSLCAVLSLTSCANVTKNFGLVNLDITLLRGGQPAPFQRLVIWINETRIERVTDAQGKLAVTESYSWEGQTLAVVGPLRHSPEPVVAVSLALDPGKQYDKWTAVSAPKNTWNMSIRVDVP